MSNFKPMACGVHGHTDEGSLDGGCTVGQRIARAEELGRIADCVTDHGTMNALASHWFAAKKNEKIKSIHGIELYVIDHFRPYKKNNHGNDEPRYYHLTILFKDSEAYKYFCRLSPTMESRAIVKWGERKPLVYFEELKPISGHIVICSGCLIGAVQKNILGDRDDDKLGITHDQRKEWARQNYEFLREIAGPGNFFVEIFPHIIDHNWRAPDPDRKIKGHFVPILEKNHVCGENCKEIKHFINEDESLSIPVNIQREPNLFVLEMAKKYGDPIVISEDSHVARPEDKIVQDVRLGNGRDKWKFYNNYSMMDSNYWVQNLKSQLNVTDQEIESWIDNSYKLVDLFKDYKFYTAKDHILVPTTNMIYGESTTNSKEKLKELIDKYGRMPTPDHPQYHLYKERLDYEVSVLADNGIVDFLPYFFVIEDAAQYARQHGLTYNARGSAGGCLVAYLLNITITDPIKYNLPFERFLSLGRIKSGSFPDIDTDWEDRQLILDYILKKYKDKASLISTNMLLRFKSSIKDVERYRKGSVEPETNMLLRSIPSAPQGMSDLDWLFGFTDKTTGEHINGFLEEDSELSRNLREYLNNNCWIDDNNQEHKIWDDAQKCLAITRNKGIHAGGVVIMPHPVSDYIPLITPKDGDMLATAYTMKEVEGVGGIKYDFLGVSTLASIGLTMRYIKQILGIELKWEEFPHDPEVYEQILHKGILAAIFQLHTNLVKPFVIRLKPRSINDIANICALVRPGALDAPSPDPSLSITSAEYFVLCRQGKRRPYYIHPDLEPILNETYGVILYQEQALRIFRDIGGMTFEEAEAARRGIGKKDRKVLINCLELLKQKCLERGWTEEQATRLFETIEASSRYSFNKSHAVSYAIVAYNGAWLKKHYPVFFWLGELTTRIGDNDKIREYMIECGKYILNVDIKRSDPANWKIEEVESIVNGEKIKQQKLRPPISIIKGCGSKTMEYLKMFLDAKSPEEYQNIINQEIEEEGLNYECPVRTDDVE